MPPPSSTQRARGLCSVSVASFPMPCRRVVRPLCPLHQAHCLRPRRRRGHEAAAGQPGLRGYAFVGVGGQAVERSDIGKAVVWRRCGSSRPTRALRMRFLVAAEIGSCARIHDMSVDCFHLPAALLGFGCMSIHLSACLRRLRRRACLLMSVQWCTTSTAARLTRPSWCWTRCAAVCGALERGCGVV